MCGPMLHGHDLLNDCKSWSSLLFSLAQPENHAEAQEVTIGSESMPVARCISTGGRPPARITWISSLGGEARDIQEVGPQVGTVTVTSRYSLVPVGQADGVKVTCKVEHESFEEPIQLPVTLSVRCEYGFPSPELSVLSLSASLKPSQTSPTVCTGFGGPRACAAGVYTGILCKIQTGLHGYLPPSLPPSHQAYTGFYGLLPCMLACLPWNQR